MFTLLYLCCIVLHWPQHTNTRPRPANMMPATGNTANSGKWPPVITRYDHHKAPHLSLCLACVATWHTCHQRRILSTYCLELSIVYLYIIYIYAIAILSSQPHLPSTFRPPLGEVQLYKRSAFCLQTSCFNIPKIALNSCCMLYNVYLYCYPSASVSAVR